MNRKYVNIERKLNIKIFGTEENIVSRLLDNCRRLQLFGICSVEFLSTTDEVVQGRRGGRVRHFNIRLIDAAVHSFVYFQEILSLH